MNLELNQENLVKGKTFSPQRSTKIWKERKDNERDEGVEKTRMGYQKGVNGKWLTVN